MSAVVFCGPTIAPTAIAGLLPGAVCLPPAGQGDLYRAARAGCAAIGLIDGYFEGVPAVWHKEVLWAIDRGIPVYGAASMGALRAAELAAFGMRGVGAIFEAYRDGRLEDDAAVAVLHGPAETGYLALSEALVNVEATLERALAEGLLDAGCAGWLRADAAAVFYQERTWSVLLARAEAAGQAVSALRDWLPEGRVDRKRLDAEAMLAAMAEAGEGSAAGDIDFAFAWTANWDDALAGEWSRLPPAAAIGGDAAPGIGAGAVLDELRLEPTLYRELRAAALLRRLTLAEAERHGPALEPDAASDMLTGLRRRHGLATRAQLDDWLAANDLATPAAERLIEDHALIGAFDRKIGPTLRRELLDVLRLNGDYPRLAERAREKARLRAERGLSDPIPADVGMVPPALLDWYFRTRLERPLPDDLNAWVEALDLTGLSEFYRLVASDYLYWLDEATS